MRGVVVAGGCDVHRERLGKFGRRFPGAATHCADALADHGKAVARWNRGTPASTRLAWRSFLLGGTSGGKRRRTEVMMVHDNGIWRGAVMT